MTRPISRQRLRHIAERWKLWLPNALVYARANFPADQPLQMIEAMRRRHAEILLAALHTGLPWDTICTHLLDNPIEDEGRRWQRVEEAIARREARMGRVKGRRKTATRGHDGHQ